MTLPHYLILHGRDWRAWRYRIGFGLTGYALGHAVPYIINRLLQ